MVTIEELKLGNRTLEALKFLLSQITELETAVSQINISEIKEANTLTKEQIATLQDVKSAVEAISSDLNLKKSDFDEKKQIFDINMSAFINDKADFDEKKADFDSKNNTALSNFAFISSNVEKINSTSALLAEAKTVLEAIKPMEQRTQAALDTIVNSQAKFAELEALKTTLLELKRSLENISTTGLITDTKVSTTQTYSSKKIEDLVNNTKTALTADIESKTDSLTTIMNNQKQSITTLDGKINTTQGNLNNLATSVSTTLSQKVDATTYNTFATKVTNDLSNKANKNDVPSITSLEAIFQKITDKIDAYTKPESDDKFVAKTDIATEDSAGIFKITNEITGSRSDVVVTEKAVANNALSFEPYNKVEVDVFSETNKESTVNVKDIFKDGSCKNFYQFNNNCDEYNHIPRTTANNNISYVEGKFGAAVYYNTPGETYPVVQDTNMFDALGHPTQWAISTWAKADDTTSMTSINYRLWFFGIESNNRSLELRIQTISGQPKLIFALWGDVQILDVNMSDATSWHNYIVSYNNGVTTIYKDGVSVWTYNKSYEITNGRGSPRANFKGAIDQFRFFNRAITASEAKTLSEEARSTEKSFISLKGIVYLSDKSSVPGRYLNTTKVIEAQLPKAQQKANGTYFIKVKQDNSLELVDIRPEFHHKSTTAEYYLDGAWYDKTGIRLQPQTYLPYSVIVTSKSITSVNFENIYPSSKELGVGQRWINEKPNRQNNFTYKNETGRSIQISCYVNTVPIQTSQDGINWVSHPAASTAGECEIIIPAGYFYKTAIVGPVWLELK